MLCRTCSFIPVALALVLSVGCADADAPANTPSTSGASAPDRSAAEGTASAATPELTADTLNAFGRGLRKELEAVRAAQAQSASAITPAARGEAIQASFETATIPQGANAAGLPEAQYRAIRETVTGIFRTLDFQGKIDGPLSIDLARADEATKQRLGRDAFADLSPSSAAALRAQMDQLVPIWIEYVNATAVAG